MYVAGAVHCSPDRGRCGNDSIWTEGHRHRYISLSRWGVLPTTIPATHWKWNTHSCIWYDMMWRCSASEFRSRDACAVSTDPSDCPMVEGHTQLGDEEEDDEHNEKMTGLVNVPVTVLVTLIMFVLFIIVLLQVWVLSLSFFKLFYNYIVDNWC